MQAQKVRFVFLPERAVAAVVIEKMMMGFS